MGSAGPTLAALATAFFWYTAWLVLMSDGRCQGFVGRFGLVYGPPLHVLRRTDLLRLCLRIRRVFFLFRTCAPVIINSLKQLLTVLKCHFRPSTLAAFYQK